METEFIKHFLPSQLVEHFDVEKIEQKPIPKTQRYEMRIYLTEKNILAEGYTTD